MVGHDQGPGLAQSLGARALDAAESENAQPTQVAPHEPVERLLGAPLSLIGFARQQTKRRHDEQREDERHHAEQGERKSAARHSPSA